MNGPLAAEDEGLRYILPHDGDVRRKFTLRDAQRELKAALMGDRLMREPGGWLVTLSSW